MSVLTLMVVLAQCSCYDDDDERFQVRCTLLSARLCLPKTCLLGRFRLVVPSRKAKLCTYLQWFTRPYKVDTEPYYGSPLPVTKLRSIFRFRVGARSSSIEQGRIGIPKVPRHSRRCTFCTTNGIGDERHYIFECPQL